MQHLRSLEAVQLDGSWVTIGAFDGVHLGHQSIIRRLVEGAHRAGQPAVVITFFPHPSKVLHGNGSPFYLTTPEDKAALLAQLGIDLVVTLKFDRQLASHSADDFMHQLSQTVHLRHLLVGHDFALGRGREGNFTVLKQLGEKYGYEIEELPPVSQGKELISSSRIRELLLQNDVERAAQYLGRRYSVEGAVVHGDGRGRALGVPTANLDIWKEQLIPGNGIYATLAFTGAQKYLSVSNVGLRPTFESQDTQPRVEAYIMDFDHDLYGQDLRLEFVAFLRPELRFPTVQALVDQMKQDILQAQEVLSHVT
jgi:riboflavin kinase/FMN adenylyltransferase